MRTTLTLDDDVAAKLEAEARQAGRPFQDIVNETLRHGLVQRRLGPSQQAPQRKAFKITTRDLGNLRPGLSLDNVAARKSSSPGSGGTVNSPANG